MERTEGKKQVENQTTPIKLIDSIDQETVQYESFYQHSNFNRLIEICFQQDEHTNADLIVTPKIDDARPDPQINSYTI